MRKVLFALGAAMALALVGLAPPAVADTAKSATVTVVPQYRSVSSGRNHSCGIQANGTLWCWGKNNQGQLGAGFTSATDSRTPIQEASGSTNWLEVSAGGDFTCALKSGGTLWCWGFNADGQLGVGNLALRSSPTPVVGNTSATAGPWNAITAGGATACALRLNRTLWCWGSNVKGQLGNNSFAGRSTTPVPESSNGIDWTAVNAGGAHACATKLNGFLFCWGDNTLGQVGNGQIGNFIRVPTVEATFSNAWRQVSTGRDHTCAVKNDGSLWCWGSNSFGQLGINSTVGQTFATQEATFANTWSSVTAGGVHSCAIKLDRTAWCWGGNLTGQLGNGSIITPFPPPANQLFPLPITGNGSYLSLEVGLSHSCGIRITNRVSCWGGNADGQLGNGTGTTTSIPTPIL